MNATSIWSRVRAQPWWLDAFFEPMFEVAFSHLMLARGKRLLHLGCGLGAKTEALRRLGFDATGVDIDGRRAKRANQSWPNSRFVRADMESLPFGDATFDVVFSFSVLQLVSQERTIAEALRVLRPGGKALFIENLAGHPIARGYRSLSKMLGWRYVDFELPRRHLDLGDVPGLFDSFTAVTCSVFHLTTPLALVFPALSQQVLHTRMRVPSLRVHRWLSCLDRNLIRRWPVLSRYGWMSVITADKADPAPKAWSDQPHLASEGGFPQTRS